ncbi:MAG: amidase [Gemmatimonadetes bacterium]|nr:amidase [Gemmatimonadota bacterium]
MLSRSIADIVSALRDGEFSATELMTAALDRHAQFGERLQAYKLFDAEGALESARAADQLLASDNDVPPLTGIPISVKDLYGVDGLPTFAGTRRQLPEKWSRDAWLVARLRGAGAITVGKTHMVEMAFGGVGINPNWDTPWNPWDDETHRIPGGSSSGAGVSLWEGSALIALGSDTGGSIRIPAAFTGTVGQRTTRGRWPTEGVVPLSHTLDTVGALTRTVEDQIYFFGCVDPKWGDPQTLLERLDSTELANVRMAVPQCGIWDDCERDIVDRLGRVLSDLGNHTGSLVEIDGGLLDDAFELSLGRRPITSTECRAFLETELPGWLEILHPIVGSRVAQGLTLDDPEYLTALEDHRTLASQADKLFEEADILVLPGNIISPPPVADLADFDRYGEANAAILRPTYPISALGLTAISIPVGIDGNGMPIGLQLVAPGGQDEELLGVALAVERELGTASRSLGHPPGLLDH